MQRTSSQQGSPLRRPAGRWPGSPCGRALLQHQRRSVWQRGGRCSWQRCRRARQPWQLHWLRRHRPRPATRCDCGSAHGPHLAGGLAACARSQTPGTSVWLQGRGVGSHECGCMPDEARVDARRAAGPGDSRRVVRARQHEHAARGCAGPGAAAADRHPAAACGCAGQGRCGGCCGGAQQRGHSSAPGTPWCQARMLVCTAARRTHPIMPHARV